MIVGLIRQKVKNGWSHVLGVVEWPEGISEETLLRNWVGKQGITDSSIRNFGADACSVTPWSELRMTSIAYCDQKFVIEALHEKDDEGKPLYWNNENGWVDRESADVFDGYERQELHLPVGGCWLNVTP